MAADAHIWTAEFPLPVCSAESPPKSPRCEALRFASVVDQQMFAAGSREAVSVAHVNFGAFWLKCS